MLAAFNVYSSFVYRVLMIGLFLIGNINWITKQIKQFFAKSFGVFDVIPHINILVKIDIDRIRLLLYVRCNAVFHLLFFRLVCAENTIPENESSCVIFIDILLLRAMVYPVV